MGWQSDGTNISNGLINRSSLNVGRSIGRDNWRKSDGAVLHSWRWRRGCDSESVSSSYGLIDRNSLSIGRGNVYSFGNCLLVVLNSSWDSFGTSLIVGLCSSNVHGLRNSKVTAGLWVEISVEFFSL